MIMRLEKIVSLIVLYKSEATSRNNDVYLKAQMSYNSILWAFLPIQVSECRLSARQW
jgi:hypothetical protein